MRFAAVRAVFAKDLRSLLPIAILAMLLSAADVVIQQWQLVPMWGQFRQMLLILVGGVLTLSVFQLDSGVSVVDDWLCRPVRKRDLLLGKLSLLFAVTYLPAALTTFFVDLAVGAPLRECLQDALLLRKSLVPLVAPMLLLTAIVTRTLVQALAVFIGLFICVFVIPGPFVAAPGPMNLHIGDALLRGQDWLVMVPAQVLPLLFVPLGFWLVYWRRRILAARILLVAATGVMLLVFLLPMWLLPWESVFSLQRTLEGARAPRIAAPIYLRSNRACFPATLAGELRSDAAFNAAREASNVRMWSNEDLRDSGPDSLAFLSSIGIRRLPHEWGFKVNHVRADYYGSAGKPLFSLRPTDFSDGTSHAWVVPAFAVRELAAEEMLTLKLSYSLTLLEPHSYRLPTDGGYHELAGMGFCSAKLATTRDNIEVECFSGSPRHAQISASLNEVPLTRDSTGVDLSPGWTRWLSSQRVKLNIGSPRLAAHDTITVTAWTIAGYRQESVVLPGILGADTASCPLPVVGSNTFQQSQWRDAAPHETSSIGVEAGVQLEVLDFGGTGSPIVLLPGLGATAHSFDELAPQLARHHRVIALTRRGTGYSSRPDFGFDTPRLAQDVVRVMDAMDLSQVLLVGHSIAGDELTWLGGHHPERFTGLVYLDAAYDRARQSGSREPGTATRLQELSRRLPPEPPRSAAAFRSFEAMSTLLAARGHLPIPEGELIAFWQADKPWLDGLPNMDPRAQQAIVAALRAPGYAAVKVPALAVYAIEDPDAPLRPWYDGNDKELLATLAEIARIRSEVKRKDIELFRRGVAKGQVLEMQNAEHYIIQSNPEEVLEAIEKFSAQLPAS